MADAKVCDRCGKFYLKKYVEKFKIFQRDNRSLQSYYKDFDLCDDCYEIFEDWIEAESGN